MEFAQILDGLTREYRAILGDNFIGMYVHGSVAMGCYNPEKSDIDYIVVCGYEPDDAAKRAMLDATLSYMPYAPKKGLEMHLMRLEDCLSFANPARFCLHYSPMHTQSFFRDPDGYIRGMRGGDPDLAAHLTVVRERGICWAGAPIAKVFGPVPREAYIESLLDDAEWEPERIMYHVLNRCRTLAYLADGSVLSKREGGEWALSHGNAKDAPVIREALNCYATDREMAATPESLAFCAEALEAIRARL